jgi:hypothetical protein
MAATATDSDANARHADRTGSLVGLLLCKYSIRGATVAVA